MQRFCFALDLKPDAQAIAQYEAHHKAVWPEILSSIKDSGVTNLEIYRVSNRLFMILEADESFSLEEKAKQDGRNIKVQEWEALMWQYQQALPGTTSGHKWVLLDKIFSL